MLKKTEDQAKKNSFLIKKQKLRRIHKIQAP